MVCKKINHIPFQFPFLRTEISIQFWHQFKDYYSHYLEYTYTKVETYLLYMLFPHEWKFLKSDISGKWIVHMQVIMSKTIIGYTPQDR